MIFVTFPNNTEVRDILIPSTPKTYTDLMFPGEMLIPALADFNSILIF